MTKCSSRHNWTPCSNTCGCGRADGQYVVYLAETEQVVCWQTGLKGRLDNPALKVEGSIDGLNCFIMDSSQSIRWLNGRSMHDYRTHIDAWYHADWATDNNGYKDDPYATVCKLVNRPFPAKLTQEDWLRSAVVVMDVWDQHGQPGASSRLQDLAPAVEAFVAKARANGALIIHSPSTMGNLYEDPGRTARDAMWARKNALHALTPPGVPADTWQRAQKYYLGLVDSGFGGRGVWFDLIVHPAEDAPARRKTRSGDPRRQHEAITILDRDAVCADEIDGCDSYKEILALTQDRPYLIYVGTATNWCILRRLNGMRSMYKAGKSLWIVRDLTDSIAGDGATGVVSGFTPVAAVLTQDQAPGGLPVLPYLQQKRPGSHFRGTDLVVDWIGWNLPGTRTATRDTEFPELGRYRFPDDTGT